jgi:hypothetical protein
LDDEFYTTEPENLKYKGNPRPELDDAWNSLIESRKDLVGAENSSSNTEPC